MTLDQTRANFAVRLVSAEYYQAIPIPSLDPVYSEYRGAEIKHVPIVRVFGSTLNGVKTCLHVHGVFPYFYVPHTGGDDSDRLGYRLAASLDAAINVSLGSASSRNQHVFKVQLISGMPLYGYHEKEHQYFKVYFYNPAMVKRAANLLQNGTVFSDRLQPHEAHIPYVQQFMIDYNLHGMSMIELRHVRHRLPIRAASGTYSENCAETASPFTNELDYLPHEITPQSTCKFEVDALASDILNRVEIEGELALNPGLVAIWEEEKARRVQLGLSGGDSQLVQPQSPTRPVFKATENDIYQQQRLAQRLLTLSQMDDSSITESGRNQSSYPLETDADSNLLSASYLEHHVGPRSRSIDEELSKRRSELVFDDLPLGSGSLALLTEPFTPSADCSVLDPTDAPLLDILNELADENICGLKVDDDSLLGSQHTINENHTNNDCSDEDKEDDNNDLNLTLLQLDSLSWSQGDECLQKSPNSKTDKDMSDKSSTFDYLRDLSVFDVDTDNNSDTGSTCDNTIPQCDGPADFSSEDSDFEQDVTLQRQEKRICHYKSKGRSNQEKLVNVTPSKRKNEICETSRSPAKSRKLSLLSSPRSQLPKGSPMLNSPGGRPSRSYSPLSIIVTSPRNLTKVRQVNLMATIDGNKCSDQMQEVQRLQIPEAMMNVSENQREHCHSSCGTDQEDICNVTFTQYLDTQRKRNARFISRCESIVEDTIKTGKEVIIVPKFNPPKFDNIVKTMETYGIPVCRNKAPFFSNYMDVTNRKEVAHKILKVPSKRVFDLPQFGPNLEGVTSIRLWRAMKVEEVYPSGANIEKSKVRQNLASQNKTVIVPLATAPLPQRVKIWSRGKEYLKRTSVTKDFSGSGTKLAAEHCNHSASSKHDKHSTSQKRMTNASNQNNYQPNKKAKDATGMDASLPTHDVELSRLLGISCGQIESSSQTDHFKIPCENLQDIKPLTAHQFLTVLCLEVHVATRGDLLPDPKHDPIRAIFYAIHNDAPAASDFTSTDKGVLVSDPSYDPSKSSAYLKKSGVMHSVSYALSEEGLFENLLTVVKKTDPDILVGWELESLSWGYLFQRAANIGINLAPKVSRIPGIQRAWEPQTTELSILTEIKMPGRIVLDVWRIMRHEIALQSYTFENIMYHVMHQRLSRPSFATLTQWWEHRTIKARSLVVDHYITKVVGILKIIEQLDIIGKTTEFARLYGIQFFEVFSRGSQFQVESVMLRLAKPSNYVPVSPSPQQRATMRAPESLPLIMEPESVFYSDPLIVLDFQSLYPSIIIAHNYCFSTCLGRIENIGQSEPFEFGATTLKVTKRTIQKLGKNINFSPIGVAFVKPEIRTGILPRMLTEYLDTRLMVKKAMKDHSQTAHTLQRALNSRQRGLKLLANVTFGYTHANFSGRMPCIEIGDSIVSKARETLERAIKLVESTKRWNARVVYGDTDSLFVLLPGRSRREAFEVGAQIASAVTLENPKPMKLKLEKIMQPSILQTKKRYCGYMYESPDQEKPIYLAKGIETVRRDGCPAVSKILEKSLRILFDTRDVSQVKSYVIRQLDKILCGRVSIQDLTFAKEFRGLQGYKSSACVPALELTRRLTIKDPRAIPRTSERVPYIIVAGAPNQPLFQCVRSPWELITDTGLRPNALYYITRVIIPPLNRCFNLLGVDVNAWFEEMPHRRTIYSNPGGTLKGEAQKSTISQYFGTMACAACGRPSNTGICTECSGIPNQTIVILHDKIRQLERSRCIITAICQSCVGRANYIECASLDCPTLYRRVLSIKDQYQISNVREIVEKGNSLQL